MSQRLFSIVDSVFNVKLLVGAFNQEKALVGAFSMHRHSYKFFGKVHREL